MPDNPITASSPLTAADRCDRCGAAAQVRATLPAGSDLLFCRHHYTKHQAGLIETGAAIQDSSIAFA